MKKGYISGIPRGYYKKIILFLKEAPEWFKSSDIISATNFSKCVVLNFLLQNVKRGYLERRLVSVIKRASRNKSGNFTSQRAKVYEYTCKKLPPIYCSNGEVAEQVFQVMKRTSLPLTRREIFKGFDIDKNKECTQKGVNIIIYCWKNSGAVIESPPRHFKLKDNLQKRPLTTNSKI